MNKKSPSPKDELNAIIERLGAQGETVKAGPIYKNLNEFILNVQVALQFAIDLYDKRLATSQEAVSFIKQLRNHTHTQMQSWLDCKTVRHRDMIVHTFEILHDLQEHVAKKWPQLETEQPFGEQPSQTFSHVIADIYEQTATQCLMEGDLGTFSDLRARCMSKPHLSALLPLVIEKTEKYSINISDDNNRRIEFLFDLASNEITVTSDYSTRGQRLSSDESPYTRIPLMPIGEFVGALEASNRADTFARRKDPTDKKSVKMLAAMTRSLLNSVAARKDPIETDWAMRMARTAQTRFGAKLDKIGHH